MISLPSAGRLAVEVRVRASQPVIDELELLVNGRIVASTRSPGRSGGASPAPGNPGVRGSSLSGPSGRLPSGSTELRLDESVQITAGSWIAARSRSRRVIESAFTTTMAAHTSPVYVEVANAPFVPAQADGRPSSKSSRVPGRGSPSWPPSPRPRSEPGWSPSSTRAWRRSGGECSGPTDRACSGPHSKRAWAGRVDVNAPGPSLTSLTLAA